MKHSVYSGLALAIAGLHFNNTGVTAVGITLVIVMSVFVLIKHMVLVSMTATYKD